MSEVSPIQCPGILVVDDEESMRMLFSELLKGRKYTVFTATDTQSARRILDREALDLVICDEHLPGENGLEFLTELKTTHPSIPRILTTGTLTEDLALRSINEAGLLRYLPKPVLPADLYRAVEDALAAIQKEKELRRDITDFVKRKKNAILHLTVTALLGVGAISVAIFMLFILLYLAKCLLGIDLLPNHHLGDFL